MTKNNRFDGRVSSPAQVVARVGLGLLTILLVASGATAHGPPAKRDQDFRLLADHNDDCGGDDSNGLAACNDTHDLVGLDLRESYDDTLGDLVQFRFMLNGGQGNLKDVLTLKSNGVSKTFELRTSNNVDFQGTGFDAISKATPARNADGTPDGTRIVVEAGIKLATLGGVGATLTEYRVESFTGATRGDYMPGGYYNAVGVKNENPPQGDAVTNFERTTGYVLQGPAYYATVAMPAKAVIPAAGTTVVDVGLTNPFRTTAQVAAVTVSGATGFTATWVGANGADPAAVDLTKAGTRTAELRLRGDGAPAGTGTLMITVTTNLGGRSVHQLPYELVATAVTPTEPVPDNGDKGAPSAAAPLAILAVFAFAALRRRS